MYSVIYRMHTRMKCIDIVPPMEAFMKFKSAAVCVFSLALVAAPVAASAHEHFHGGGLVVGLVAGTAAIAAAVITAPFVALASVAQPVAYAPPPQSAYYAPSPQPAYYAPAPVAYAAPQAYYPAPAYGYYAQAPVYYAPRYYVAR